MEFLVASTQHYDIALTLGDQTHSSRAMAAINTAEAKLQAQHEAAETSGGEPADWKITSCDPVPAPMRRAA